MISLYDLASEKREVFIPDSDVIVPYIGLKHVEADSLQMNSFGRSDEVTSNTYKFNKGDILFGTLRPYFRKLIIAPFDGVCSTEFSVISPKCEDDRNFVFYLMAQKKFIKFATVNSIGDRPRTKWHQFSKFALNILAPEVRFSIGRKLRNIDLLIENNRRRMRLLEESARQLYKEWFVRLRFPGHEKVKIIDGIPEGWEMQKLGLLLDKINRLGKIKKSDYLEDGPIPCVDQSQLFIGGYTADEEAKITMPLPLIVFGDHTRCLKFIDFPFACGADGTQLLQHNDERLTIQYFYYAVDAIALSNYFYARHFKFLKDQMVLIPKFRLVREFTEIAQKNLKLISTLRKSNRQLEKARDLLLPKLMSGEITV